MGIVVKSVASPDLLENCESHKIDCANWEEFKNGPATTFKTARVGDMLYVLFKVEESSPKADNHTDQKAVCVDSCVEFFCRPAGGDRYFNFEFNANGACVASSRVSRKVDKKELTAAELSDIIRIPEIHPDYWTLLIGIPISLITDSKTFPIKINGNFYKCGDECEIKHYLSWSPIPLQKPDFHCPEFFGEIIVE